MGRGGVPKTLLMRVWEREIFDNPPMGGERMGPEAGRGGDVRRELFSSYPKTLKGFEVPTFLELRMFEVPTFLELRMLENSMKVESFEVPKSSELRIFFWNFEV